MADGKPRFTHHVSRITNMKILPPANENERQALKLRLEARLGQEQGGSWRVDIINGRYGWYVRPVRLRTRTSGGQSKAPEQARDSSGNPR